MNWHSRRPSSLSLAVGALIALLSVVGCAVTLRVSNEHEHELLAGETRQAAALMQMKVNDLYSSMGSIATAATLAAHYPQMFHQLTVKLQGAPGTSILLAEQEFGGYVVIGRVGPGFKMDQFLSPTSTIGATMAKAMGTVTPTAVVHSGNHSTVGFALGPPKTPRHMAVYEQLSISLHLLDKKGSGPFNSLNFALYGSHTPDPRHLVLDNTSHVPLPGPTVQADVPVGNTTWLAVASAKGSLSGTLAREAGWIILILGLLIALLVAIMIDGLAYRQRYAEEQVDMRTFELARSMANLKEAQTALVQRERLAAVGQMASVVGHELRNPLTAVTNAVYLIRATLGPDLPESAIKNFDLAEREVHRAATLAQDLTDFVRPRRPLPEPFGLAQLLEEVMQASPPPPGVTVRAHVGRLMLVADRMQVAELLTNLITNAYQAVGDRGGGHVWVWAHADAGRVRLSVQDTGPGVAPEVAAKMFDPFVTTRARGTGLGLAIVRRIAEDHGGSIVVESIEEGGTRFAAVLPGPPEQDGVVDPKSDDATAIWTGGEEHQTRGDDDLMTTAGATQ